VAKCEVCGTDYDQAFVVTHGGTEHTFDCFECAIHSLAPTCSACGTRIIGHGVEADSRIFCSAHCSSKEGITELQDRA
jgi:hypothetical protein